MSVKGLAVGMVMLVAVLGLTANRAQEPVQVIDDEHLVQLVSKTNEDYRSNLRNVACREEITFIRLDVQANPKRQTRYEFDYSLPTDARRPVAVIELRVPVGKPPNNFEARESVRDLNWRDLLRIFEPAYQDSYVYGSTGEKTIEGQRAYVLEFRPVAPPVAGFEPRFEPFLEGYRVQVPLAGRALVDAQTFRIMSVEFQGMELPASRRSFPAKSIDFLQYSVTVDFEKLELGGRLRHLPRLIRSELATSEGRIIEERRYRDFRLLTR